MQRFLMTLSLLFALVHPVLAQRSAGSFTVLSTQVVPLVIQGEGWKQTVLLTNVDESVPAVGSLRFFRRDGTPWTMALASRGSSDSFPISLAPGQSTTFETEVSTGEQQLGWAIVSLDQYRGNLLGQTIFQKQDPGQPDLMAAVLLSDRAFFRTTVYFDNTAGNATGVGILIPDPCGNSCVVKALQVTVRDTDGTVLAQRTVQQKAGTLEWMDLAASFPETIGKKGIFVVQPVDIFGALLSSFSLHFAPNRAFVAITPFED